MIVSDRPTTVADPPEDEPTVGATISPSSLGVFFALDQCQRYLRLALMPKSVRANRLTDAGVVAERIPPTLSVEGKRFERVVEDALRASGATCRLHRDGEDDGDDPDAGADRDAPDLVARVPRVGPGQTAVFGQHRLAATLGGWSIAGQPDLVSASRDLDGRLSLLVCDIKASREPRLEHRLQVALYARMLRDRLPGATVEQAVLYRRPPVLPEDEAALTVVRGDESAAAERLGIDVALLSIAEDAAEFDAMLGRILLDEESEAARTLRTDLDDLPFHLERKCDVCAYNELCLKRCRETGDLSLVPYLAGQDKAVLRLNQVETVAGLASVKADPELDRRLRGTWPVGPRMAELTARAGSYLRWQREDVEVSEYLDPAERGYSTLPAVSPAQHPNLVQIFVDAQLYDPDERVYALGALVRVHRDGILEPGRERRVVRVLDHAPRADDDERVLLTDWLREVLTAVGDLAFPRSEGDRRLAPIHLYMFEENAKQVLLGAINRNADAVFGVRSLFTLLTQRAAYETGNISVVGDEIERQWNLPMLCQSLQAVASYKGFRWDGDRGLRAIFRHRFFDQLGRYEDGEREPLYAPRRSRFKSDVPIEYAHLAWGGASGEVSPPHRAAFAAYGTPTLADVEALGAARLDALAYLVDALRPNVQTTKSDFDLADLLRGVGDLRPAGVLSAMKNFVVVERHVVLNQWRATHVQAPERRVLTGDTLIGVYRDVDQPVDVRRQLRETWEANRRDVAAWRAKRDAGEEGAPAYAPAWRYPPVVVRLELTAEAMGSDPAQGVRRSDLKDGSWVTIAPRWAVDGRPDAPSAEPYTPTPRQLMLTAKGKLSRVRTEGSRLWVELALEHGIGRETPGFTFGEFLAEMFEDGAAYTVDANPSAPGEANRLKIIEDVESGLPHPFAEWLDGVASITPEWPAEAAAAQRRFFDGLLATGQLVVEPDKERYIGEHGSDPVLLVQGPPGTGKSFTTAYAVLARIQGALAVGLPYVVAVSCHTHAAVNVVLEKIAATRDSLARLAAASPTTFAAYFDAALLEVPVLRWTDGADDPATAVPPGCRPFGKPTLSARVNELVRLEHAVVGGTPSKVRRLGRDALKGKHGPIFDLCVIDEASQMTAPDALQATLGLKPTGRVVFVGDHRQMPPIVHNDWEREAETGFDPYAIHRSVFDLVRERRRGVPQERFSRSFRLQPEVAAYLRREIYAADGIDYHSLEERDFTSAVTGNPLVEAVLNGPHSLLVVRHDERDSQQRNAVEADIVRQIYLGLDGRNGSRRDRMLDAGVVVPHRAQRAEIRDVLVRALGWDDVALSVDTVERFQGGEREVIVVSATESDPAYLRQAGDFLFDPRRLTVAISRARQKLIVVASRSVFDYLPADLDTLHDTALWRNLLHADVTEPIWTGELGPHRVEVFGNLPRGRPDILG